MFLYEFFKNDIYAFNLYIKYITENFLTIYNIINYYIK